MTIIIKLHDEIISKEQAVKQFGAARIEARINEAIEAYYDDPLELCTWMDGMEIIISQN